MCTVQGYSSNALLVIVADKSMMIFYCLFCCCPTPVFVPLNIWPFVMPNVRPGHASIYLFGFWHALCHVYICVRLVQCYKKGQTSLKHHVTCCYDSKCQAAAKQSDDADYCPLNISSQAPFFSRRGAVLGCCCLHHTTE